jgi:hypothetical protein
MTKRETLEQSAIGRAFTKLYYHQYPPPSPKNSFHSSCAVSAGKAAPGCPGPSQRLTRQSSGPTRKAAQAAHFYVRSLCQQNSLTA